MAPLLSNPDSKTNTPKGRRGIVLSGGQAKLHGLAHRAERDAYLLGRALARAESGTLLFDEVDKAHPLVLDLFLQILDYAAITLATGWRKNLSGFHVVFHEQHWSGRSDAHAVGAFASINRTILARGSQQLRPELVGRVIEKIVFNRLPYAVQCEICEHMIVLEQRRLRCRGHVVSLARISNV